MKADKAEGNEIASEFRAVQQRAVAADHTRLFELAHAAQAGRRRYADPRGKVHIGHAPVLLQFAQYLQVDDIEVKLTEDGRLLMRYKDGAFTDPFIDKNVSDGTVKMFAYLVLLHDPLPHPILCVEEPENQLYPELMEILAEEFIAYAERGGQVFVSTHSPQFLNAVPLNSLYLIEKTGGISSVHRVSQDTILSEQVGEGWKLGTLWEQGEFNGIANRMKAGL